MDLDLKEKNALVCGSTQGIGRAVAEALAGLGARITLLARHEAALEEVRKGLPRLSGQAHDYRVADFSQPDRLEKLLQAHLEAGNHYHILVNNTGGPPGGSALQAAPDEFRAAFEQHLICNQILIRALVPAMREAGYGRIINIISTSVKMPIPGLGVSNTIRGAVASWAKTLATELGPLGITVNNVLPGYTATQRLNEIISNKSGKLGISPEKTAQMMKAEVPAGRFAEPSEVAGVAAFLATPAAGYVNGINLPVDGGRTGTL